MKPALLDINVLLALAWPNHQHHALAHRWFAREARHGWATCSFTQLGFVRLSSNPAYTPSAVSPPEAAGLLDRWVRHPRHAFWDSAPATRAVIYARAVGHQQVNDAWLVEVARQSDGRVVTFDRRISLHDGDRSRVTVVSD
jgi:toxin-antitoxin system PIN domain toxin